MSKEEIEKHARHIQNLVKEFGHIQLGEDFEGDPINFDALTGSDYDGDHLPEDMEELSDSIDSVILDIRKRAHYANESIMKYGNGVYYGDPNDLKNCKHPEQYAIELAVVNEKHNGKMRKAIRYININIYAKPRDIMRFELLYPILPMYDKNSGYNKYMKRKKNRDKLYQPYSIKIWITSGHSNIRNRISSPRSFIIDSLSVLESNLERRN